MKIGDKVLIDYRGRATTYSNYYVGKIVGEGIAERSSDDNNQVWLVEHTDSYGFTSTNKYYKSSDKHMAQTPIFAMCWYKLVSPDRMTKSEVKYCKYINGEISEEEYHANGWILPLVFMFFIFLCILPLLCIV